MVLQIISRKIGELNGIS